MSDKEKKVPGNSEVDKATTEESKAAEKVAKAAKGNKKDKSSARKGKAKGFFKDFKGECKKIVWPDASSVLKNTGIVLLVVTIVTIVIFAIDFCLERGVSGLKGLATKTETDADTSISQVVETTEEKSDKETEKATEAETEKAEKATEAEATKE